MYTDIAGKKWYKGNLHTHTNRSDGSFSPEAIIALYRENGYDFLSLTDHWVRWDELREEEGFVLLPGCEYGAYTMADFNGITREVIYHITGIGFESAPALEGVADVNENEPPQKIIDEIHKAGGLAFLAHPAWSMNTINDIWALKDLDGMEIYNSGAGVMGEFTADSGYLADELLCAGRCLPLIAADDTHSCFGEEFGSFIMVQADELNRNGLMEAMRKGRFYASQKPRVDAGVCKGGIWVRCDPCREIKLHTNYWSTRRSVSGHDMRGWNFPIPPEGIGCFRIEITDMEGNRAWTSPRAIRADGKGM